jgi:cytochrome c oxidase assembly protein subunit 15
VLLALLAVQHERFRDRRITLGAGLRWLAVAGLGVLALQIALGGWVSTNYAVLACGGFPACNGQWWPPMDFARGFTLLRALGYAGDGSLLPFEALVGIHYVHRAFALVVVAVLAALAWRLWRAGQARFAGGLAALLAAQLASGLSNVVLGWPLIAALAHTAGAAALVLLLTLLIARSAA